MQGTEPGATTRPLVVGDAGGTYVRVREVGADGRTARELQEAGSGAEDGSLAAGIADLDALLRRAFPVPAQRGEPAHLVIAARGYAAGSALAAAAIRNALARVAARAGADRVTLVPDGIAAYVGCFGDRAGVVASVGTGTIVITLGRDGVVRRLDGLGPLLGDAGSGYRVGLDGLKAACRWADGRRGGSERLAGVAAEIFGELGRLPLVLRDTGHIRSVARFAPAVVAAARDHDPAAGRILDAAASELAELVVDATADTDVPIALTGGFITGVPELADRVMARLGGRDAVIRPGATLDGCQSIGTNGVPAALSAWAEELRVP